ncbi:MAG: mannose-1-phosphate guanylyltransferase [Treponema sp.]|nr:mannose-1-phosphate guanylyltransferase [Treponema sp.]
MFSDVVILAGGFGERLWPASRPDNPKQFLSLGKGLSLLQNSILRALAVKPEGKIVIATRKDLLESCAKHALELTDHVSDEDKEKILRDLIVLAEPEAKHTTAPIILTCHMLEKLNPQINHSVLVLTSDHVITPVENFVQDCQEAYEAASKGNFVCFAIPPTEASTGYGYIKTGNAITEKTYKIDNFKEKPDAKTAEKYFKSGQYFWNSGMFGFTSEFLKKELQKCEPQVSNSFECVENGKAPKLAKMNGIYYVKKWPEMNKAYSVTPKIAIDNSIAEKTANAYAVKAGFKWDDVGSWDAFAKFSQGADNVAAEYNSENNFVYSDIPVALCDVKDLIIVIKNGKALVMKKGSSNLVRDVVKSIK